MAFYWVTFLLYFVDIVAYLLAPFFQQVYTDNIITRKNPEWFGPLMFCYILLFVGVLFLRDPLLRWMERQKYHRARRQEEQTVEETPQEDVVEEAVMMEDDER